MKRQIGKVTAAALLAVGVMLPVQAGAWWGPGPGWSSWGPFDGFGDMFGDMDFNLSFRGNARNRFHGYGYSYPYYGYGYPYPLPYAPVPVAYVPPVMQPAAAPEAVAELPADGDADGVVDASDLCPDSTAGAQVDAFGCEVDAAIVLRGVNFRLDSDQLTEESLVILDGVAATLTANPDVRVLVAGHTDSQGEDAYNLDLSDRRAASVVAYLTSRGVAADNLQSAGFGELQPVADNATVEGRAANRRVELVRQDN